MSIRYSTDHVWIQKHDEVYHVGISEYARQELGDVVFVEAAEVGMKVAKGDAVCSIDSLKSTSDVYAPVSGTISATNPHASEENAKLVNEDPLGAGWIFAMSVDDPKDLEGLMGEDEYRRFVG